MFNLLKKTAILAGTFITALLVLTSYSKATTQQLSIVIDQGISAAQPMAIADFTFHGDNQPPFKAQEIIGNDLLFSGRYKPIYQNQFPEPIDQPITPVNWTSRGLDILLTGAITQNGDHYTASYQLVDLSGVRVQVGEVILKNQVTFPINQYRQGIHTISDQVFQYISDIPGVATTAIAYVTQPIIGIDQYQLVISDYDGFNPKVIFNSNRPILSPSWSPDGKNIAFVNYIKDKAAIYQYSLSNGRVIKLIGGNETDYSYYGSPSYDPSGSYLTYSKSNDSIIDIYRYDLNSGQSVKLTVGGNNTEARWFNGQLIFTSDRSGNPDVYTMGLHGENINKLTSAPGSNYNGALSSSENSVIYVNNDRIVKQNLDNGTITNITNTFLDESISLSPNGLIIIYSSKRNNGKVLNLVSIDGRFKASLPIKSGQISEPSWSPYLNKN